MKDIIRFLNQWDAAGLNSAEAILVGAQHSSPRMPGARLVVNEKGETAGAVSMGCVESDLREHLLALLAGSRPAGMVHYGAAFEASLEVGLSCGGEIDVWIQRHVNDDVWKTRAALPEHEGGVQITRLDESPARQLHLESGRIIGDLGLSDAGQTVLDEQITPLRRHGGTKRVAVDGRSFFAESITPNPSLIVVGASPISSALCDLALRVGFRVSLVDPRRTFARAELFPPETTMIHEWPEEGMQATGLNQASYVAIVAHDPKLDIPALSAALAADCLYVGLLGSAKTQESRRYQLREAGFTDDQIATIHGPIGLKIGALNPAEIATSILAEMIAVRRGRNPRDSRMPT